MVVINNRFTPARKRQLHRDVFNRLVDEFEELSARNPLDPFLELNTHLLNYLNENANDAWRMSLRLDRIARGKTLLDMSYCSKVMGLSPNLFMRVTRVARNKNIITLLDVSDEACLKVAATAKTLSDVISPFLSMMLKGFIYTRNHRWHVVAVTQSEIAGSYSLLYDPPGSDELVQVAFDFNTVIRDDMAIKASLSNSS